MSLRSFAGRRQTRVVALICVAALLLVVGLWYVLARPASKTITAYFTSAAAVFQDNGVRVLGVPVGSITAVEPEGTQVKVVMKLDYPGLKLPADVRAVAVSPSLVTGRYIQLTPTYSGGPELAEGAEIPVQRTAVPFGVDELARTASKLANSLGPNALNSNGALSDALTVGAANLEGNGQAFNDSLKNLSQLNTTLANSRQDLFGTVQGLQQFVSMLAANDTQVREFNTRLADVSKVLADERQDLGVALHELSIALGEVAGFIKDNREALKSNVDRLQEVTAVLVRQRDALAEILDVAPAALGNLANAYNASSGTLDTRANLNELMTPPILLLCQLLGPNIPPELQPICADVLPFVNGTVPLPSAAEVIGALQAGQLPPVPGLALPTVAPPEPPAPLAPNDADVPPPPPPEAPVPETPPTARPGLLGGGG